MPTGGARVGAGRKRKPLAEKLEHNAGRRPIKYIPNEAMSEITGADMPPPSAWLSDETKNTQRASTANEVYEATWKWVKERKCDHLITREQIEQYAASIARYIQCEEGISTFGLLAKHPTTNMPIASPYVGMSERFLKRANLLWATIYQIVKENCETPVGGNHNEDIMEKILTGKI
jgi:4-alpha-glucanotransferase